MKLSVIVPCYNEERTLATLLERVLAAPILPWDMEVIVVDDGSRDGSAAIAEEWARRHPRTVRAHRQPRNQGKGAAVRAGLALATGDIVLIQDADLEYDPNDYAALLRPFANPSVIAVYGSRILGGNRASYSTFYWGGRLVTMAANLLYVCHLTDEPTCYKALRRDAALGLDLDSNGFEICPEITAKILRRGWRIHEVPIRYSPRSFEEGKKISWRDGLIALWVLLKHRVM